MGCPIIRWSSNTDDLNLSVLFWEHEFRHQVILSKIYKRSTSESLSTWTQISFPSTWFDEMLRCFLTWCCEVIDASHVMLPTHWRDAAILFDVLCCKVIIWGDAWITFDVMLRCHFTWCCYVRRTLSLARVIKGRVPFNKFHNLTEFQCNKFKNSKSYNN